jgi:hypothetical protein
MVSQLSTISCIAEGSEKSASHPPPIRVPAAIVIESLETGDNPACPLPVCLAVPE